MGMQLEKLIGQKLVIGIPGTVITPEIISHFKEVHAGGLILYRINFTSPAQLRQLLTDLEESLGRRLLVVADHEGGRVIMFREGITVFPDNLAVGATGRVDYARRQGQMEARELRRLGIDVNLGPVLDVLTEAYSPNIGIRSYGQDWRLVARLGGARLAAMQEGGLSACAKHFPGKGHAPVDAHLGLPVIDSTWQEMWDTHLPPFQEAINLGVDVVMSSHPYYPNLDPSPQMIATFSRRLIHDLLRRELNFSGVIASDDLEMGAVKVMRPIGEAGVLATRAGHDLLLVCHDLKAQKEVYYALLAACRDGQLSLAELEESGERIQALVAKRDQRFAPGDPVPEPEGAALAAAICREAVRVLHDERRLLPLGRDYSRLGVIFPRFSSLDAKIMIETAVLAEADFLKQEFGTFGWQPHIQIVGIEPTPDEIQRARELAARCELTIFFCYDAHLYPSNRELLEAVQDTAGTLVAVLLRDPYDVEFIKPGTTVLTAFGWRAGQLRATIEEICGGR